MRAHFRPESSSSDPDSSAVLEEQGCAAWADLFETEKGRRALNSLPALITKIPRKEWAKKIQDAEGTSNLLIKLILNIHHFEKLGLPEFLLNLNFPEEAWTFVCPENSEHPGKNALNLICNGKIFGFILLCRNKGLFETIPVEAWANLDAVEQVIRCIGSVINKQEPYALFDCLEFVELLCHLPPKVWLSTHALWYLCDNISGRLLLLQHVTLFESIPKAAWLVEKEVQGSGRVMAFWKFISCNEVMKKINEKTLKIFKDRIPVQAWRHNTLGILLVMYLTSQRAFSRKSVFGILETVLDEPCDPHSAENPLGIIVSTLTFRSILEFPSLFNKLEGLPLAMWTSSAPGEISPITYLCRTRHGPGFLARFPQIVEQVPLAFWSTPSLRDGLTPFQDLCNQDEGIEFLLQYPAILHSILLGWWFIQTNKKAMPFFKFCSLQKSADFLFNPEFGFLKRITPDIWLRPIEDPNFSGFNFFMQLLLTTLLLNAENKERVFSHLKTTKLPPGVWTAVGRTGSQYPGMCALYILLGELPDNHGINWLDENVELQAEIPKEAWAYSYRGSNAFLECVVKAPHIFIFIRNPNLLRNMPEKAWLCAPSVYKGESPLSVLLKVPELALILFREPGVLESIPPAAWCLGSNDLIRGSLPLLTVLADPLNRVEIEKRTDILCSIPSQAWTARILKGETEGYNPLCYLLSETNTNTLTDEYCNFLRKIPREAWLAAPSEGRVAGYNIFFLFFSRNYHYFLQKPELLDDIPREAWGGGPIKTELSVIWSICSNPKTRILLIKKPGIIEYVLREDWTRKVESVSAVMHLACNEDATNVLVNNNFLLDFLAAEQGDLPDAYCEEEKRYFEQMKKISKTLPTFKKLMSLFVGIESTEINYDRMALIFRFNKTKKLVVNFKILELILTHFNIWYESEEGAAGIGVALEEFDKLSLERLNWIYQVCSFLQGKSEKTEAEIEKIEKDLSEKLTTKTRSASAPVVVVMQPKKPAEIDKGEVPPPGFKGQKGSKFAAKTGSKNKGKKKGSSVKTSSTKSGKNRASKKAPVVVSRKVETLYPKASSENCFAAREQVRQHLLESDKKEASSFVREVKEEGDAKPATQLVWDRQNDQFQKRLILRCLRRLKVLESCTALSEEALLGAQEYQCMLIQFALRSSSSRSSVCGLFNLNGARLLLQRDAWAHFYFPDFKNSAKMPEINDVLLESMDSLCQIFGKIVTAEMERAAKKSTDAIYEYCSARHETHDIDRNIDRKNPRAWFLEKITLYQGAVEKLFSQLDSSPNELADLIKDAILFYISRIGELRKHLNLVAKAHQDCRNLIIHQSEDFIEEAILYEFLKNRRENLCQLKIPDFSGNSSWVAFVNLDYSYPPSWVSKILRLKINSEESHVRDMTPLQGKITLTELIGNDKPLRFLLIPIILPDLSWFGLTIQFDEAGKMINFCCVYAMPNQTEPEIINLSGQGKYQKILAGNVREVDVGPRLIENLHRSIHLLMNGQLSKERKMESLRREQAELDFRLYMAQFVAKK